MSVRYACTYQCGEGVCMCTSMHVPCKSLRGSASEGSLTSLVGQALTVVLGRRDWLARPTGGALVFQKARRPVPHSNTP